MANTDIGEIEFSIKLKFIESIYVFCSGMAAGIVCTGCAFVFFAAIK